MLTNTWPVSFQEWITAWNSRNLKRILSHYSDVFTMSSPQIAVIFRWYLMIQLSYKRVVGVLWVFCVARVMTGLRAKCLFADRYYWRCYPQSRLECTRNHFLRPDKSNLISLYDKLGLPDRLGKASNHHHNQYVFLLVFECCLMSLLCAKVDYVSVTNNMYSLLVVIPVAVTSSVSTASWALADKAIELVEIALTPIKPFWTFHRVAHFAFVALSY